MRRFFFSPRAKEFFLYITKYRKEVFISSGYYWARGRLWFALVNDFGYCGIFFV